MYMAQSMTSFFPQMKFRKQWVTIIMPDQIPKATEGFATIEACEEALSQVEEALKKNNGLSDEDLPEARIKEM